MPCKMTEELTSLLEVGVIVSLSRHTPVKVYVERSLVCIASGLVSFRCFVYQRNP